MRTCSVIFRLSEKSPSEFPCSLAVWSGFLLLFGAFYNFNILFSVAYAAGGGTVNYNRVLILLHLIFVFILRGPRSGD